MKNTPLAQKPWFIILMFFCFFPVGLILMWIYPGWKKETKWIVTGCLASLFIVSGIYSSSPSGRAEQAKADKEQALQAKHDAEEAAAQKRKEDAQAKADKAAKKEEDAMRVMIGDDGILTAGANNVLVATDIDSLNDLSQELFAKDDVGVGKLMEAGRVFSVPDRTKAKLIDYGPGLLGGAKYHIRIESGQHDTDDGWVPNDWMRKN